MLYNDCCKTTALTTWGSGPLSWEYPQYSPYSNEPFKYYNNTALKRVILAGHFVTNTAISANNWGGCAKITNGESSITPYAPVFLKGNDNAYQKCIGIMTKNSENSVIAVAFSETVPKDSLLFVYMEYYV